MPPVIHAYKLSAFGNRAAVAIAIISRYAADYRDCVYPVYTVVVYIRTATGYGITCAVTPVDISVYRTSQRQTDRRTGPKASVPRRHEGRACSPDRPRLCPTGSAGIEIIRLRTDQWNAPSGKVLVECPRTVEHSAHVGDAGGIPTAYVLVERRRIAEHLLHVGDVGGIPAADVLVERVRKDEHLLHVDNVGGVPAADVPVERRHMAEHIAHVDDAGSIPAADVTVERRRIEEHRPHAGDAFDPDRSTRH